MDKETRLVGAAYVGNRDRRSAQMLWDRILDTWKEGSAVYTDFWDSYERVIPKEQHQPVGKKTGKTSLIERLNNTLRQRIGRLFRKSLSFPKKLENHIGMIFNFLHHYNESLLCYHYHSPLQGWDPEVSR
ncbi:MAG: hypothetical protein HC818_03490 [Synechococcaceae cyanobacterium RM1_1_27]|nr:hypothetical protein [Synechococcaceae cyanobacterium RM1_1_27]